jgi:serine/threonine protein kinase
METAFHLSSLVEILEEQGVAHGDLAPSNIIIETDGSVHLIDFDNASSAGSTFPAATMAGQPMMLAPEIRLDKQNPTIESDRYALAVLLNMVLLRRHPADGQALVPSDMDSVMTSGRWPERDPVAEPKDVPFTALGITLCKLFDRAFLIEPTQRPSANAWRQALSEALHAMVIHDCGNAFVHDKTQVRCPWCQVSVEAKWSSIAALKITVPKTGARYSLALQDGKTIVLGRQNLGGQATVSGRHLELTPMGGKVLLRHIGHHPTSILKDGNWYNLQELWIDTTDLAMAPIALQLADLHIDIGL